MRSSANRFHRNIIKLSRSNSFQNEDFFPIHRIMHANMSEMTDQIAFKGKKFCYLNKHNCCVAIGHVGVNFQYTVLGRSIMVSQNLD